MGKPVEVELRSVKQEASLDEHVFSYARTGLKLTTFRHAWEGACKAAKIYGLRFHDLRHTFATRLRAKGVREMDIMTLLGHTTFANDVSVHSRYAAEFTRGSRCAQQAAVTVSSATSGKQKRARWRLGPMGA